jgi:hypothetical protein
MGASYGSCLEQLGRRGLLPADHAAVFVAGSVVRGWGNAGSDLDIDVVLTKALSWDTSASVRVALDPDTVQVEFAQVGGRRWDIAYWLDEQVDQLFEKVSWDRFDLYRATGDLLATEEMEFLDRLTYAVPMTGERWLARRRRQIEQSAARDVIASRALKLADLFVEDAIGQLRADDLESAVLSARLAFGYTVDALLASHGQLGLSGKWRARRFRQVTDQDVLTFEAYWAVETMQTFDREAPGAWVEQVVELCRTTARGVAI